MKSKYKVIFLPTYMLMDRKPKFKRKNLGWHYDFPTREILEVEELIEAEEVWINLKLAHIFYVCDEGKYEKDVEWIDGSSTTSILIDLRNPVDERELVNEE